MTDYNNQNAVFEKYGNNFSSNFKKILKSIDEHTNIANPFEKYYNVENPVAFKIRKSGKKVKVIGVRKNGAIEILTKNETSIFIDDKLMTSLINKFSTLKFKSPKEGDEQKYRSTSIKEFDHDEIVSIFKLIFSEISKSYEAFNKSNK